MVIDKTSIEWLHIKEHCESRINEMRIENDSTSLDIDETNKLRGMIEFAKEILELNEVESKPEIVDTTYNL